MNGEDEDDADGDGQWSGGGAPPAALTAGLGGGGGGAAVLPLPLQVPVELLVGNAAATVELGCGGGGAAGAAVLPLPLQVPVELLVGNAKGTNVNDLVVVVSTVDDGVEGVKPSPPFVAKKSPKNGTTFSPLPVSLLLLFFFTATKVWFYSYFK